MDRVHAVLDTHVFSAVVLVVAVVGAIKSVAGDFSYGDYVSDISILVGATAVGRGLAAYKK